MGISVDLLPLTTITGASSTDTIYQDLRHTVDTSRYQTGVVSIYCTWLRDCGFEVEGSDDGQSFVTLQSATQASTTVKHLNRQQTPGSTYRLYRYLRWTISASGANWEFCGRASVVLK